MKMLGVSISWSMIVSATAATPRAMPAAYAAILFGAGVTEGRSGRHSPAGAAPSRELISHPSSFLDQRV